MKITMTKTQQQKKQGTKTVFETVEKETKEISEQEYNNIINSASFFRRLGGSCTQQKEYTCRGYKVYKDTLTSPDKETRTIREFEFE
jgi:hypothetical protein